MNKILAFSFALLFFLIAGIETVNGKQPIHMIGAVIFFCTGLLIETIERTRHDR